MRFLITVRVWRQREKEKERKGGGEKKGGVQRGAGEQKKDAGGAIVSDGKLKLAKAVDEKGICPELLVPYNLIVCMCIR